MSSKLRTPEKSSRCIRYEAPFTRLSPTPSLSQNVRKPFEQTTAEAGLNDGFAFPFVYLGLLLAGSPSLKSDALLHWLLVHFIWNLAGGAALGIGIGAALVRFNQRLPQGWRLPDSNSGLVAVGLAFVAYGCAALIAANGFVAVFCEAVAIRNFARSYDYSRRLSHAAEQLERVAMMVLLTFLGMSIGAGLLHFFKARSRTEDGGTLGTT